MSGLAPNCLNDSVSAVALPVTCGPVKMLIATVRSGVAWIPNRKQRKANAIKHAWWGGRPPLDAWLYWVLCVQQCVFVCVCARPSSRSLVTALTQKQEVVLLWCFSDSVSPPTKSVFNFLKSIITTTINIILWSRMQIIVSSHQTRHQCCISYSCRESESSLVLVWTLHIEFLLSIWIHLICPSPCKLSSMYFKTRVWSGLMCNDWFYLFHFFSERRRASGGLSLEELRRNMQFSPIDRNGVLADNMCTDTVFTSFWWLFYPITFLFLQQ